MPTTHTWNPNPTTPGNFILDPTHYVDGAPFGAGDTLVVDAGHPGAAALPGTSSFTLATGAYVFNEAGGTNEDLEFQDIALDGGSSISVTGPKPLYWYAGDLFANGGAVQVGTAAAPGSVTYFPTATTTTQQSQLVNGNAIQVQNGSLFSSQGNPAGETLVNDLGAVIAVGSGSLFDWDAYHGAANANLVNDGSIVVQGAAGRTTGLNVGGNLTGTGLLAVKGAPGAASSDTSATIHGSADATVDVANGQVGYWLNPTGGSISFLDGNGAAVLNGNGGNNAGFNPFGAAIYGFKAGDTIAINDSSLGISGSLGGITFDYSPATHALRLVDGGSPIEQLGFQGDYVQADFHVAGTATGLAVTTTSTANVAAPHYPPSPDPLFDAAYYIAHNPDVAAAGTDPYRHYVAYGWREGRNPDALFDTRYYLGHNPDVAAAGIDPLAHYEQDGWREGRDPSALFSTGKYLAANPDVKAAGLDPLLHWTQYGGAEGRSIYGV